MRGSIQISMLALTLAVFPWATAKAAFSLSNSQHQPYASLQQNGVDMGPLSSQYPGYDPYTAQAYQNFNSSLYPTNYQVPNNYSYPYNSGRGYGYGAGAGYPSTSMPQSPSQAAANAARMPGGNLRSAGGRINIFVDLFNIFAGKTNPFEGLLSILSDTIGSRFASGLRNTGYVSTSSRLTELEAYAQSTATATQTPQTIDRFWGWCESCAQSPAAQNPQSMGNIFNFVRAGTPVQPGAGTPVRQTR